MVLKGIGAQVERVEQRTVRQFTLAQGMPMVSPHKQRRIGHPGGSYNLLFNMIFLSWRFTE